MGFKSINRKDSQRMPIDDPVTWAQGFAAVKAAFDSIR
jgi:hypothetical protein